MTKHPEMNFPGVVRFLSGIRQVFVHPVSAFCRYNNLRFLSSAIYLTLIGFTRMKLPV